jgi:hypothetical protein
MSYEWRRSRDLSNGCGPPTMEPDAKPCGANVRSSVSIAQTRHSLPASSGNSNSPTTRPRIITHGAAWMPGSVPESSPGRAWGATQSDAQYAVDSTSRWRLSRWRRRNSADEEFLAFLEKHPDLRDRFASIVSAVENSGGNLKEADTAEERILEEMRHLGREAMQGGRRSK